MRALLATFEREGVPALYDTGVVGLVRNSDGAVVGVHARRHGTDVWVRARGGVVLATGSFNLNAEMTAASFPTFAKYGQPLGIDTNDGAGVQLGQSVGGATRGMDGVIATASIYPPAELIKGIVVNNRGERFVPEDAYHGRLAHFVERQPDHQAFLIVDEEIFAYPEKGSHKLVDGYETVAEMEEGLGVPAGALTATLDEYNRDVADGEDHAFHKYHDWLKPLHPPFVVFDISVTSSDYHYIALGGLATDVDGRVQADDGATVDGLYAVGACAAHFPLQGSEYASGMSLGPGSWWGRRAGRHAAGRSR